MFSHLLIRHSRLLTTSKRLNSKKKIRQQSFTLDDYLQQMRQMRKLGSMSDILGMLPGVNKKALEGASFDEKKIDRIEAIITSMTKKEETIPK